MSPMIRPRLAAESLTASTFMFVLVVISSLQEGRWTHVSRYYWLRCVVCRAGWRPAHSTARASAAGDVLPALGVLLLHVVRTLAEGGLQVVEDLHVRTQVGLEVVAQLVVGVGRGTGPVAHDRLDLLLLLVGLVRDLRGLLGHHVDGLVDGGVVVCDHRCSLLLRCRQGSFAQAPRKEPVSSGMFMICWLRSSSVPSWLFDSRRMFSAMACMCAITDFLTFSIQVSVEVLSARVAALVLACRTLSTSDFSCVSWPTMASRVESWLSACLRISSGSS